MKKTIQLKESELHRMISESVKRVLNEVSFDTAQRAYLKSIGRDKPDFSPAMKRKMEKNPFAAAQRINNIRQGASNAFNREYGVNLKNIPYGSGDDINMDINDKSKPAYTGRNFYYPHADYFVTSAIPSECDIDCDDSDCMHLKHYQIGDAFGGDNSDDFEYDKNMTFTDKVKYPSLNHKIQQGEKAVKNALKGQVVNEVTDYGNNIFGSSHMNAIFRDKSLDDYTDKEHIQLIKLRSKVINDILGRQDKDENYTNERYNVIYLYGTMKDRYDDIVKVKEFYNQNGWDVSAKENIGWSGYNKYPRVELNVLKLNQPSIDKLSESVTKVIYKYLH